MKWTREAPIGDTYCHPTEFRPVAKSLGAVVYLVGRNDARELDQWHQCDTLLATMMTELQRMQVALESKVSVNTVRRWESGVKATTVANDHAIRAALEKLGIKLSKGHPREKQEARGA